MSRTYKYKHGDRIDGWELVRQLGRGGNAEVWEARRQKSDAGCALKLLRNARRGSEPYERFVREIAAVRELQDQAMTSDPSRKLGILPILDANLPLSGTLSDVPWMAMPLATPIRKALRGAPILDVVAAVYDVGMTLGELSVLEIHHRDIKPENLFFYDGRYVMADFGLVKRFQIEEKPLTRRPMIPGPYHYLPSEAIRPIPGVDDPNLELVDVYCLAKTLWVLLTGDRVPPFHQIQRESSSSLKRRLGESRIHQGLDIAIELATAEYPNTRSDLREFLFILAGIRHWGPSWLNPARLNSTGIGGGTITYVRGHGFEVDIPGKPKKKY